MTLARIPVLSPLAFIAYLGMLTAVPITLPYATDDTAPREIQAAPAGDCWTLGDLRRLPCGDEVPVVVLDFNSLAYRGIINPAETTAHPVDETTATPATERLWFVAGDSRGAGRRGRQVLVLRSQ